MASSGIIISKAKNATIKIEILLLVGYDFITEFSNDYLVFSLGAKFTIAALGGAVNSNIESG